MTAELERPMTLKRPPKPAADDRVDPIDVAPAAVVEAPAETTPAAPAATESAPPATTAPRGKKREITVPLSNRISLEASQVLERAAEEAGSIRAALEQAIFAHWGRP